MHHQEPATQCQDNNILTRKLNQLTKDSQRMLRKDLHQCNQGMDNQDNNLDHMDTQDKVTQDKDIQDISDLI